MHEKGLYRTLRITQIIEEARDYKRFVFADDHGILYKPGQYLTLVHQGREGEVRRSYSITSAPLLHEPLSIGVKRIENGFFSRMLIDQSKVGDRLTTTGAGGFFILPDHMNQYKQVFFFAAGSGITPIFSLIKTLLHFYPDIDVVLVYSNPSFSRTLFLKDLEALGETFPKRFFPEFLFSDSPNLLKARLYRDLLAELVKKYSKASLEEILFYTCGPEAYMRMVTYSLNEMEVPPENMRRENFIIQKTKPHKSIPPDQKDHKVVIRFAGHEYSFTSKYPDTILSAAKKQNIPLPYSCEVGRCGNCVARCASGQVWLSYNEVLTEKDLQNGLTLTCVGYPVNGDIILEI